MSARTVLSRAALACAALTVGCESHGAEDLPSLDDSAPVALQDALLYLGHAGDEPRAVVLDIARSEPQTKLVELAEGDAQLYARPGQPGQALVLTSGESAHLEDDEVVDAVDAEVSLFTRAGRSQRYRLPGRFEALALSDDGRFAVAHARSNDAFDPGRALAVLDLALPSNDPRAARLVNPEKPWATVAQSFAFAPASLGQRLALGFATDHVVLFDLQKPDANAITAALTFPTDPQSVEPREALFTDGLIYVRAEGSESVYVMNLIADASRPLGFTVTPTSLSVGSQLQDIELLGTGDSQRLLALGSDTLMSFDRFGGGVQVAELGQFYGSLFVFHGPSPLEEEPSNHAVLVEGSRGTRLAFIDLDVSSDVVRPDPELLDLGHPIRSVLPLLERNLCVVSHLDGAMSLVDLAQRTAVPVATGDAPSSVLMDAERARLWVTTDVGELGTIDLNTLSGERILLNDRADAVLFVPSAHPRVAVLHPDPAGHVTLLDAAKPAREGARELEGFVWSGLFD